MLATGEKVGNAPDPTKKKHNHTEKKHKQT